MVWCFAAKIFIFRMMFQTWQHVTKEDLSGPMCSFKTWQRPQDLSALKKISKFAVPEKFFAGKYSLTHDR
jgi:hypothetical protein